MLNNPNNFSFVIADDDVEDQTLIHEAVKSIDISIQCTAVFNGYQLLELLLKKGPYKHIQAYPDAIILDLNMPVLDGLGALKQIKCNPDLREIPVFTLYSIRKGDYSAQCRSFNVAGFYAKPNNTEDLKNILKEIYLICGGKSLGIS